MRQVTFKEILEDLRSDLDLHTSSVPLELYIEELTFGAQCNTQTGYGASKHLKYTGIENLARQFLGPGPQFAPSELVINIYVLTPSRLRIMTGGATSPQLVCMHI